MLVSLVSLCSQYLNSGWSIRDVSFPPHEEMMLDTNDLNIVVAVLLLVLAQTFLHSVVKPDGALLRCVKEKWDVSCRG